VILAVIIESVLVYSLCEIVSIIIGLEKLKKKPDDSRRSHAPDKAHILSLANGTCPVVLAFT
jgi:hypothetical protein